MLKTRFGHKDQTMSSQPDPVPHNNNNKAITNPLAMSLLIGLNNKNKCNNISESDFVRSPKSPLDFRMLSTMADPFFLRSAISSLTAHLNCCSGRPPKVGLSIVDSLADDHVVFGPALRIKSFEGIDKHPKPVEIEKEMSSVIFEIGDNSCDTQPNRSFSRVVSRSKLGGEGYFRDNAFASCLSEEDDMEEDYTCIIAHGANPKTTHIYGDRVLECHKNVFKGDDNKDNIFALCNFCNKKLDLDEDIYMYRERAFCSAECRTEEIMIDEDDLDDSSIPLQESLKKLF